MSRLAAFSSRLARIEAGLSGLMIALVLVIVSAGSLARFLGQPMIWADEAAIAAMTWSGFLGASALFARRGHMAIELAADHLGPAGRRRLALLADLIVLVSALGLAVLLWRWFDLPGLLRTGSGAALAQESFNFLYLEPTQTLGIRKVWIWTILPVFAFGAAVHALALIMADVTARRRMA